MLYYNRSTEQFETHEYQETSLGYNEVHGSKNINKDLFYMNYPSHLGFSEELEYDVFNTRYYGEYYILFVVQKDSVSVYIETDDGPSLEEKFIVNKTQDLFMSFENAIKYSETIN